MRIALLFLLIGFLIYGNSLFNNFVWEDWGQVVGNPLIQDLSNIPSLFNGGTYFEQGNGVLEGNLYRPVMLVYFTVLASIFGKYSFAFHFAQVLIHCTSSFLVFAFLKRFMKQGIAIWLSLLFLVHPINTEAVSYISIANDPLYFLFGMLGLIFLEKNILIMSIFVLFSLFSKESGGLFLCISALYAFLFYRANFVKVLVMNVIVAAVYLFIRINIAHIGFGNGGFFPMDRLSLSDRLLNMPAIIIFYFKTFLFPFYLSIGQQWRIIQTDLRGFLLPLFVILVTISLTTVIAKKVIQEDKQKKIFIFFCLWLMIGLVPYLQIFPLNMTVGERWFYFAQVGFLGALGILTSKLFRYKYTHYILAVIILLLAVRTVWRNFDWKNDATLFNHDVLVSADSYMIQTGLGVVNFKEGKYEESEYHFLKSLKLFSHDPTTWVDLGSLYEKKQDFNKALYYFKGSLDKYPTRFAYDRIKVLEDQFKLKD